MLFERVVCGYVWDLCRKIVRPTGELRKAAASAHPRLTHSSALSVVCSLGASSRPPYTARLTAALTQRTRVVPPTISTALSIAPAAARSAHASCNG